MTEKKDYITPELTPLGDIEEITKGQGWRGHADQLWILPIFWGVDPTSG